MARAENVLQLTTFLLFRHRYFTVLGVFWKNS